MLVAVDVTCADRELVALARGLDVRLELRPEVQSSVAGTWVQVTSENLLELTDFPGFKRAFDNLFGFDVEGVDYSQPVETELTW